MERRKPKVDYKRPFTEYGSPLLVSNKWAKSTPLRGIILHSSKLIPEVHPEIPRSLVFHHPPGPGLIHELSIACTRSTQARRWRSNGQPVALVSPVGSGGVYVSAVSLLGNLQACFNSSREWIAIGNYVVVYSSNCLRQAAIGL